MPRSIRYVVILDIDRTVPVYHALGDVMEWPDVPGRYQHYTLCGRPWGNIFTTRLRRTQAMSIGGRQCLNCFGDGV